MLEQSTQEVTELIAATYVYITVAFTVISAMPMASNAADKPTRLGAFHIYLTRHAITCIRLGAELDRKSRRHLNSL